jgi:hypothetical protein
MIYDYLTLILFLQSDNDSKDLLILTAIQLDKGNDFLEAFLKYWFFINTIQAFLEFKEAYFSIKEWN